MALKDLNDVIDGKQVYVRQWTASNALTNLNSALRVFGGNFTPFVDKDWDFQDVLRILYATDESKFLPTLQEFICAARVEGKEITPSTFNGEYSGDLLLCFKIFAFVCQVNYQDFFAEGRALMKSQDSDSAQQEQADASKTTTP